MATKTAVVKITGAAPYSQSKHYDKTTVPQTSPEETKDKYEKRTWNNRCHYNTNGHVEIPAMAFKNCLTSAAQYKGDVIPGQGKKTYKKKFESGIIVDTPMTIEPHISREEVQHEWLFVPSDGRRGGSSRVNKCFPVFRTWAGTVEFIVCDETITKEVFEQHIKTAGKFIGLGRFRPEKNGYYGRFKAEVEWKE